MTQPSGTIDRQRVDDRVEAICQLGCRTVSEIIDRLERGETVAETDTLDEHDRAAVLAELKSIMAVYGGTCRL
jgi:hypothetical protein